MSELLCLLNLARFDESKKERIGQLMREPLNWDLFFDLTETNAVLLLTLLNLKTFGFKGIQSGIRWNALFAKAKEQENAALGRFEWAQKFLANMHEAGIEVILLKGALLGSTIYETPAYKKMNDIDILVKFSQAEQAAQILKDLSFYCIGDLFGENEISQKSHHAPPYVSTDLKCVVGLHWGLHSKHTPWKSDIDGIWARKVPIEIGNSSGYRMSWEDTLLHLCIHLPFYKTGLRELADVYNLILFCEPAVHWTRFAQRVKEWNAADAAYRVLSLSRSLMPFEVPNALLNEWLQQASPFCIRDTEKRVSSIDLLLRSRCTHTSKIEKAFTIFKLTENYRERLHAWAAIWRLTFWPKYPDLLRISGCLGFKNQFEHLRARFLVPYKILSALARDYGVVGLILITIINIGIVCRDTFIFLFSKKGRSLASHPARKLLEALE